MPFGLDRLCRTNQPTDGTRLGEGDVCAGLQGRNKPRKASTRVGEGAQNKFLQFSSRVVVRKRRQEKRPGNRHQKTKVALRSRHGGEVQVRSHSAFVSFRSRSERWWQAVTAAPRQFCLLLLLLLPLCEARGPEATNSCEWSKLITERSSTRAGAGIVGKDTTGYCVDLIAGIAEHMPIRFGYLRRPH